MTMSINRDNAVPSGSTWFKGGSAWFKAVQRGSKRFKAVQRGSMRFYVVKT